MKQVQLLLKLYTRGNDILWILSLSFLYLLSLCVSTLTMQCEVQKLPYIAQTYAQECEVQKVPYRAQNVRPRV